MSLPAPEVPSSLAPGEQQGLLARALRYRVPQVLAVYVGAVWALVQLTNFAVARYGLTDNIVDIVALALVLLAPVLVAMQWLRNATADRGGMSRWQVGGVLAAALVALVVPHVVFGGQLVGRATRQVQVVDEQGKAVTADVPRAELVRTVMLMPLATDAKTAAWLGVGAADAVSIDLSQNPFVRADIGASRITGRLKPGEDVGRLSLARYQELARDGNAEFFVTGEVGGTADALKVELAVYRADPLRELGRAQAQGPFLEAIDALTPQVRKLLDLKAVRASGDADAPVASLLSSDVEALRLIYESDLVLIRQEGVLKARTLVERALQRDGALAVGGFRLYGVGLASADTVVMKRGLDVAFQHRERLTEELRCTVRSLHALYAGQREQSVRIAKACTELFPAYADGYRIYALLLTESGDYAGAITQYERLRSIDRANDDALLQLGELRLRMGEYAGARTDYAEYLKRRPTDTAAVLGLVEALVRDDKRADAQGVLEDALAKRDTAPALVRQLASLRYEQGDEAAARSLIEPLLKSTLAAERSLGLRLVERIQRDSGQLRAARASQLAALKNEGRPDTLAQSLFPLMIYPETERASFAALAARLSQLQTGDDPFSRFQVQLGRLILAIKLADAPALRSEIEAYDSGTRSFDVVARNALLTLGRARLADIEGRHAEAEPLYAQAGTQLRASRGQAYFTEVDALAWRVENAVAGKDLATAIRVLAQLRVLRPATPMTRLLAAEVAAAQGEAAAARSALDAALAAWSKADPEYLPAQRARALAARLATAG